MPKDKKNQGMNKPGARKPKNQARTGGLGSANNFFETAEELANRNRREQQQGMAKQQQKDNPEKQS
ncbi:MAG: hypothetical protein GX331_00720 [Firmicutes bacterium]|jgi:hypothetical protein|nr:hypothetical protein [Bacillota bacterium]